MAVCMTAHAQPRLHTPEIYFGVHGGVTASTVLFNPTQPNMTPITNACTLGGNGGFVFRYSEQKYCALQVELNYQHRGWATGSETVPHTYYNLHYVELPLLMHIHFGKKRSEWFLNLGPEIGYCVWDESHLIDHPFNWGVAGGTGVLINGGKAGVYQLEARFNFSFGGVYGTRVTDKYSMASPMDLSVNLGWLMPIKDRRKRIKE